MSRRIRRNRGLSPEIVEYLEDELPDFIPRAQIEQYTGGLVTTGQMINLHNKGMDLRVLSFGDRVVYKKEEFIKWVKSYYGGIGDGDNNRAGGTVRAGETGETGAGEAGGRD